MSKHTKGPWRTHQGETSVVGRDGHIVASCGSFPYRYRTEEKANATLISIAPDMLEMLKRISECSGRGGMFDSGKCIALMPEIRALIKRAEGGEDE